MTVVSYFSSTCQVCICGGILMRMFFIIIFKLNAAGIKHWTRQDYNCNGVFSESKMVKWITSLMSTPVGVSALLHHHRLLWYTRLSTIELFWSPLFDCGTLCHRTSRRRHYWLFLWNTWRCIYLTVACPNSHSACTMHRSNSVCAGMACCGLGSTAALFVTTCHWRRYAQMRRHISESYLYLCLPIMLTYLPLIAWSSQCICLSDHFREAFLNQRIFVLYIAMQLHVVLVSFMIRPAVFVVYVHNHHSNASCAVLTPQRLRCSVCTCWIRAHLPQPSVTGGVQNGALHKIALLFPEKKPHWLCDVWHVSSSYLIVCARIMH